MHNLFDQLTRIMSGDFMRKDDCCGGNGGEPAVPSSIVDENGEEVDGSTEQR